MLGLFVPFALASALAWVMPYSSAETMAFTVQRTTSPHWSSPWRTTPLNGSLEMISGRIMWSPGFSIPDRAAFIESVAFCENVTRAGSPEKPKNSPSMRRVWTIIVSASTASWCPDRPGLTP